MSSAPAETASAVSPKGVGHMTTTICPQCGSHARISEPFAFGGMDRLRATLGCGHVVLRAEAGLK